MNFFAKASIAFLFVNTNYISSDETEYGKNLSTSEESLNPITKFFSRGNKYGLEFSPSIYT
ncbi:MAG: hypothetical protein FJZ57_08535, partial [Chlamydiae bacterium]|nr:hypothetical protein [Chlamydiota bacterium]